MLVVLRKGMDATSASSTQECHNKMMLGAQIVTMPLSHASPCIHKASSRFRVYRGSIGSNSQAHTLNTKT